MVSHRARRWRGWPAAVAAVGAAVTAAAVVTGGAVLLRPASSPQGQSADRLPATTAAATGGPAASSGATPSPTVRPAATVGSPTASPPDTSGSSSAKKGVSTWEFAGVGAALADVGASWYWNWSAGRTPGAGELAEFVPMIWGPGSVTPENLARAKANGAVLLGFNEPDFASQSNMSVEQALDLWPQLQATGLRLGSPAPAVGAATAGGWLDRFLAGAAQRGYRVDFIAVHWYGSDFSAAAVGHLHGYLQAIWDRYHKPIWLTEFALIRWVGSGAVYPTDSQQAAFISGATAMLEGLSFVERYAWFALPSADGGDGTGLYRDGDSPTAAGLAYRAAG